MPISDDNVVIIVPVVFEAIRFENDYIYLQKLQPIELRSRGITKSDFRSGGKNMKYFIIHRFDRSLFIEKL